MRINQFVALSTGLSRRAADQAIQAGRITINGISAKLGAEISHNDAVAMDGKLLKPLDTVTIMLHKPVGYVTSRDGQGSPTIYDLLPKPLHYLKPVGRLDKDSSGLLLLTNDGQLAQRLTHPKYIKDKIYKVQLDTQLKSADRHELLSGVTLNDGPSHFHTIKPITGAVYQVTLQEGRNRQIRRTFAAVGYKVVALHRIKIGDISLGGLRVGKYRKLL